MKLLAGIFLRNFKKNHIVFVQANHQTEFVNENMKTMKTKPFHVVFINMLRITFWRISKRTECCFHREVKTNQAFFRIRQKHFI